MSRSRCFVVIAVVAGACVAGCRTYVEPAEPVATVEVTSAPYDIETYPHTYYEGRVVYLYNGGWYYRDGGRWARYRSEPPQLYQYRQRHYVQQAPSAPRNYPSGGYPQPTYQNNNSAPPAVRTQ